MITDELPTNNKFSDAGRWKTLGMPLVKDGENLPPIVAIALSDLQIFKSSICWRKNIFLETLEPALVNEKSLKIVTGLMVVDK